MSVQQYRLLMEEIVDLKSRLNRVERYQWMTLGAIGIAAFLASNGFLQLK